MQGRIFPRIRTPEDLGIAYLGDPQTSITPIVPCHRVDRAEYGRKIAELEGGRFTPFGYIIPKKRRKPHAA